MMRSHLDGHEHMGELKQELSGTSKGCTQHQNQERKSRGQPSRAAATSTRMPERTLMASETKETTARKSACQMNCRKDREEDNAREGSVLVREEEPDNERQKGARHRQPKHTCHDGAQEGGPSVGGRHQ
jgi:hypothetical protein